MKVGEGEVGEGTEDFTLFVYEIQEYFMPSISVTTM